MKRAHLAVILLSATALFALPNRTIRPLHFSNEEKAVIGKKIWYNESGCSIDKLTWWKEGEDFASFGIGHFIWFPAHYSGPFSQTFPDLLVFLRKKGVQLPDWLATIPPCPWSTRQEFNNALNSSAMQDLRLLLSRSISEQTDFIIQRFQKKFVIILQRLPGAKKSHIVKQFNRVAQSPAGVYALVDYVHFKGEGISLQEQYNNKGWGLLHVLASMKGATNNHEKALLEFVESAKKILTQRVENAPIRRNEQQWLKGWHNRLDSYLLRHHQNIAMNI